MTPLRNKMREDLRLRNLAEGTADLYIGHVAAFARHYRRSPDQLGTDDVREWLLLLQERGLSPSTRIVHHAALRFFYEHTLGRPDVMATVPRPRRGKQALGVPLVREEVLALLAVAGPFPRTGALLATLLDTGLRVAELCALQTGDLDARAGLLHVRRGKGAKPRMVGLPEGLLGRLRGYWRAVRPPGPWLFPAHRLLGPGRVDPDQPWADRPLSTDTVRAVLHDVRHRAGITRRVTPHDLRRTYATWLLEAGVELRVVQVLLGHESPDTTTRYAAVRPELIRKTPSPLSLL